MFEGRESELKESAIGVEVFGRTPVYDPKVDSIVRTEAVRLRARLSKYYATDGRNDPLVIDLPKGAYVPRFQKIDPTPDPRGLSRRRLWLASSAAAMYWREHWGAGGSCVGTRPSRLQLLHW